ncbi:MAG TPA: hypothetical protein VFS60_02965 [Thermoanaerobaculia bacterium]|nr:hypothetical protein [Thermoanaerobaculia bacterium]
MSSNTLTRRGIAALAIAGSLAFSGAAGAAEWTWRLTPYLWVPSLGTDIEVNDQEISGGSEVTLDDVIDQLDFVGMVHFEGQSGKHGFLLDTLYANLGDEDKRVHPGGPLDGDVVVDGDLGALITEAAGLYNPAGDGSGWALIYGIRVFDIDEDIEARYELPAGTRSRSYELGNTLWDALLGARYVGAWGERWRYNLRGDVSGGGTELAWNTMAGVGYTWAEGRHALLAGYRYMQIELDEKDERAEVKTTLTLNGPYFGYQLTF